MIKYSNFKDVLLLLLIIEIPNSFFQVADLAVGDLTITFEREKGVDFTMPFMNLGMHIQIFKLSP